MLTKFNEKRAENKVKTAVHVLDYNFEKKIGEKEALCV